MGGLADSAAPLRRAQQDRERYLVFALTAADLLRLPQALEVKRT